MCHQPEISTIRRHLFFLLRTDIKCWPKTEANCLFFLLTLALLRMAGPRPHHQYMFNAHTPSLRKPHSAAEPNNCVLFLAQNWKQDVGAYFKWTDKTKRKENSLFPTIATKLMCMCGCVCIYVCVYMYSITDRLKLFFVQPGFFSTFSCNPAWKI